MASASTKADQASSDRFLPLANDDSLAALAARALTARALWHPARPVVGVVGRAARTLSGHRDATAAAVTQHLAAISTEASKRRSGSRDTVAWAVQACNCQLLSSLKQS